MQPVDFTSGTVLRCTWRKESGSLPSELPDLAAHKCVPAIFLSSRTFVADLMDARRPRVYYAYIVSYAADSCIGRMIYASKIDDYGYFSLL